MRAYTGAVRSDHGERGRQAVERRLFETNAKLAAARAELEVVEAQLAALEQMAEEAKVKSLVSETALAQREWDEARRHEETMRRSYLAARAVVAQLERTQDELFDNLLV